MFDRKDVQVYLVPLHALGGHIGTATYSDFLSTILRFRQHANVTLQRGKEEDIVIGISLVPVACRVVCWNTSAYERAGEIRGRVPFGETTRPRPLEAPRYTVSIISINLR